MPFHDARREKRLARIALFGVSKSGKSLTSLILARALGGDNIRVLDTEHSTIEMYADRIPFKSQTLKDHHPDTYRAGIIEAAQEIPGGVLVIDSLSHAWMGTKGILELVDAETPSGGSTFTSGWNKVRPIEAAFWNTLLGCPMHVIVTLRSKQEYVEEENQRTGRTQFRKVGRGPVQRDGLEYEFDLVAELDLDHNLTIVGSRFEELQEGDVVPKPDAEFGAMVATMLDKGLARKEPEAAREEDVQFLRSLLLAEGFEEKRIDDVFAMRRTEQGGVLTPEYVTTEIAKAEARAKSRQGEPKEESKDAPEAEQAEEAGAEKEGEGKGSGDDAAKKEDPDGGS